MVGAATPLEQTKELIEILLLRLCLKEGDLASPNFPVKSEPGEDDFDEVEFFLEELESMMEGINEAIEDWLKKRISNSDFLELEFLLEDTITASDDVVIENETYRTRYDSLVRSVQKSFAWMRSQSESDVRNNYYVYLHKNASDGEVFYVGKGTDKRAWSKDRQDYWHKHVDKVGGLSVEVVETDLSELEALNREDYYMEKYREVIINHLRPLAITLSYETNID
jgi:hypothetical protein